MSNYKYEYGRSSKQDSTSYGFKSSSGAGTSVSGRNYNNNNSKNNNDEDDDFWGDLKEEDGSEEELKTKTSFIKRIRRSFNPIINFYQPSNAANEKELGDLDFTTSSNSEREVKMIYYKLRAGGAILSGVSLVFWIWAVYNTRHMEGQDLGMYSFLTTLVSSHYILFRTQKGPAGGAASGTLLATPLVRVLVTASHVLVCLNYSLGVLYAYTVGSSAYHFFGTYCIVFTGLWGYIAFQGFVLLTSLQRHEIELAKAIDEEDEVEESDYF